MARPYAALVVLALSWPDRAEAAWTTNGVAISPAERRQTSPVVGGDALGGAFVFWRDTPGTSSSLYGQRVSVDGAIEWTAGGVLVTASAGGQLPWETQPDGAGGAYILWQTGSGSEDDVYLQRFNESGSAMWAAGGIGVATGSVFQGSPCMATSPAGGVVVVWMEFNGAASYDIVARGVSPTGGTLWGPTTVCGAAGSQSNPRIIADGAGGVVIVWEDYRSGAIDAGIFAQRFDAAGTALWTGGGLTVSAASANQLAPVLASDGTGGAIVAWTDERGGASTPDIYSQRIDGAGTAVWAPNGIAVVTGAGSQQTPVITADAGGGAIVAWRSGTGTDLYARRIDASGAHVWASPTAVCTAANSQVRPLIIPDGTGGAIITWYDDRTAAGAYDVFAQRLDGAGAALWTPNGVQMCTASGNQITPALASDGMGGALVVWADQRDGGGLDDIYVQRITDTGALAPATLPAWTGNGAAATIAPGTQQASALAPDGLGGVFAAWEDEASPGPGARAVAGGGHPTVHVLRLDRNGAPVGGWPAAGLALGTGAAPQRAPRCLSDGRGGAYVVWEDGFASTVDLRVQRITAAGAIAAGWPPGGALVSAAFGDQRRASLVPDRIGGLLVTWEDYRAADVDVYLQRVTSSGAVSAGWPADGLALVTETGDQTGPVAVSDGVGGALVAWSDRRTGNADIYGAAATRAGALAAGWGAGGNVVTTAIDDQLAPTVATDGARGMIVAWEDYRTAIADIYVQRMSALGAANWTANGLGLCVVNDPQLGPRTVPDGAGGAIVVWEDRRTGAVDIYAGRIMGSGVLPSGWLAGGNAVCAASGAQSAPVAIADGRGGVYAAWRDERDDAGDVYATRLGGGGTLDSAFPGGGAPLCRSGLMQDEVTIEFDGGAGGAFVGWNDRRALVSEIDVFVTHLLRRGATFTTAVGSKGSQTFGLSAPRPNPSARSVALELGLPTARGVQADVVDAAGRAVRTLAGGEWFPAGNHGIVWDARDRAGRPVPSGVYYLRVRAGGEPVIREISIVR